MKKAELKQISRYISSVGKMADKFDGERDRLRGLISQSQGIYLIGRTIEPWGDIQFLIGSEEDYDRIKNNGKYDEVIFGGEI